MKMMGSNWITSLCLMAAAATGSWWVCAQQQGAREISTGGNLAPSEVATISLFEITSPSVVHIESIAVRRDVFTMNVMKIPAGTGTGFIWDNKGHVITNFHVIQGASAVQVILSDRTTWNAVLVGAEPDKDIAVLKIDAPENVLRPIKVGASGDLKVGQSVLAIGNPFGLDQTLTTGIISGLGREIESVTGRTIRGVVQTDAAINPGNSGGPLLDSSGRIIGINTAIYSPSGAYSGVGFAVPIDEVNRVVPQLIQFGRIVRPVLGITTVPENALQNVNIDGILVHQLIEGGGAEAAGIQPLRRDRYGRILMGDIIESVDGKKVKNSNDLYDVLENRKVGDTVPVVVQRGNERLTIEVKLSESK